ncbi:thioredoxin domain-containing protein 17-like [Ptychodera flava]|uniref:thioredoxin domain-containing protein 17-like n=1 Tax=Ptychodera flava TaxID=63121 RepID=UPI003969F4A5
MVKKVNVEGLDAFRAKIKEYEKTDYLYAYFSGSKGEDGKSWCPDCVAAEPVVEKHLASAPEDAVFIYCSVGERNFWKDQNNGFRKDPTLRLTGVPTLLRVGKPQKLVEGELMKDDLVKMFFEED